ncbi:hypothetical protein DL96DRAFT_586432 [Flagelloscypha sp. PMI_526]|nr:hypothetical protein DL96DRAFT_586432 [Flagelloscypha sp. PMI_526]
MVHPSLPLDILQEIIELAAESDWSLEIASALSLVSKGVQFWSDKYLFQNIVIYEDSVPKAMSAFLVDFVQDDRSPRYELARFHVRRFATNGVENTNETFNFIYHCPHLVSIALWNIPISDTLLNVSLPYLRHLTFSSYKKKSAQSFKAPLFDHITHLDLFGFYVTEWQTLFSNGLSVMPILQYLILNGNGKYGANPTPTDMAKLSQNIAPSIRVLAVAIDDLVDLALMGGNYDPRIIMVTNGLKGGDDTENPFVEITSGGFRSWTGERPEEETIWAQIERIHHAKKEREKDESLS